MNQAALDSLIAFQKQNAALLEVLQNLSASPQFNSQKSIQRCIDTLESLRQAPGIHEETLQCCIAALQSLLIS